MGKIITDVHNHSSFSVDGVSSAAEMFKAAYEKGIDVYGASEHFDYTLSGERGAYWSDPAYFQAERALQKEYEGKMKILVGAEIGYQNNERLFADVKELVEKYKPDFVVNSVHGFLGLARKENGEMREKADIFNKYLERVIESLDAPYDYDIVAHVGFFARYITERDRSIRYADYKPQFDEIIEKIIAKGKILEVNGKGSPSRFDGDEEISFLPFADVLEAYYKAGGRKISYASDAHDTGAILKNREKVVGVLKEIGFEYLTLPVCGEHIKIEL